MDLNQLRTFVTVAEEKHLTRAAERLFTSQPAISAQLKALEEELGLPLFERTPKGMMLTPAGENLLDRAKGILQSANQLKLDAKAMQGQVIGEVSVGVNSDPSFVRMTELITSSAENYPSVVYKFIAGMSADILLDIRKAKLDAGFFFGPCETSDLAIFKLADIKLMVMAPKEWESKVVDADIDELASLPWIYTTDRCPFYLSKKTLFDDATVAPTKAVFVDSEEAIRDLVRAGKGVAIVREDDVIAAEAEGWGVRWPHKWVYIDFSIAVQARRVEEPIIRAWLDTLKQVWPDAEIDADEFGTESAAV